MILFSSIFEALQMYFIMNKRREVIISTISAQAPTVMSRLSHDDYQGHSSKNIVATVDNLRFFDMDTSSICSFPPAYDKYTSKVTQSAKQQLRTAIIDNIATFVYLKNGIKME